jgi:hypothetical protein
MSPAVLGIGSAVLGCLVFMLIVVFTYRLEYSWRCIINTPKPHRKDGLVALICIPYCFLVVVIFLLDIFFAICLIFIGLEALRAIRKFIRE